MPLPHKTVDSRYDRLFGYNARLLEELFRVHLGAKMAKTATDALMAKMGKTAAWGKTARLRLSIAIFLTVVVSMATVGLADRYGQQLPGGPSVSITRQNEDRTKSIRNRRELCSKKLAAARKHIEAAKWREARMAVDGALRVASDKSQTDAISKH